jgi:hypothetical protein
MPRSTSFVVFVANSVIAVGYAAAFFAAARPLLAVYGIDPNTEAVYMARWFGVGLLATGLITWFARDATQSAAGRAIGRALALSYSVGIVLALWGTLAGPFNSLGWIAVGIQYHAGHSIRIHPGEEVRVIE